MEIAKPNPIQVSKKRRKRKKKGMAKSTMARSEQAPKEREYHRPLVIHRIE